MRSIITLAASVLLCASLASADDLRLGEPQFGGTGCPAGSAAVALSPDSKSLSILFDQYVVSAGEGSTIRDSRKNCNIAIPIQVPQGYSYSIIGIDYRGFTDLPRGSRAQLNVNYFLSTGGNTVRTSKTFMGPVTSDYLKADTLGMSSVVWTACGGSTILRANTTLNVLSNRYNEPALATVDSADVQAGIVYQLQWKRCR